MALAAPTPAAVLFRCDATTAYHDPTAVFHDGWFRLFFTLVRIEPDGRPFSYYVAWSRSRDLVKWSEPEAFTPRDQSLNYGKDRPRIRCTGLGAWAKGRGGRDCVKF